MIQRIRHFAAVCLMVLVYLIAGLMSAYGMFIALISANISSAGAKIPWFWSGVAGALALLIAAVLTVFRPRDGLAIGLIGCVLLWLFWGTILFEHFRLAVQTRQGFSGEAAFYGLSLMAASVLSCVFLARWLKTASDPGNLTPAG